MLTSGSCSGFWGRSEEFGSFTRYKPAHQLVCPLDRWLFNISTKTLTVGHTYVYRISLDDGSFINFQFGLK
ncbi:MAG: hypothetical protein HOP18_06510 [Deltaproteobacteria bacterium]|nr:hypothetical protein [Deltaproteobacteria bacterium]